MPKTFPIQLDDALHRRLKHASVDAGVSLHQFIVTVLEAQLSGNEPHAQTSTRRTTNSHAAAKNKKN